MGVGARALRAGKAVIEVGLLVKPVERQLRALQARVQAVGQKFASIGTFGVSGGGFAGLRNLFIGSLATEALLYPVKLASNIELAAAQMSTFTGDAGMARDMLVELQKFSAVAFVPAEQLSAAAAMMLRYGDAQESVLDDTKALAVIAAGNTDEFEKLSLAYTQVASAGRLQGEEMRQFKNTAFNPIREIAERTGESMLEVKKRMEAGEIAFAEVQSVLRAAVTEGGRFDGMLTRIAKTTRGQFEMAIAKAKLSLLTLGDTALPPITKALSALNGILPGIAALIERNKEFYTTILAGMAATAALAVAFVTLGLGAWVLSMAVGGLAAVLGIVGSILGSMLSPLGMVAASIAGLAAWFMAATESGRMMAANLSNWFRQLAGTISTTFEGLANALKAGSLTAAAAVMWAGLKVAWLEGTAGLRNIWLDFADLFKRTTLEMVFSAQGFWARFQHNFASGWQNIITKTKVAFWDFVNWLAHINATEQEKLNADLYTAQQKGAILNENAAAHGVLEAERQKALADIAAARQIAQEDHDRATNRARQEADKELKTARDKLAVARDEAAILAAIADMKGDEFDIAALGPVAAAEGVASAKERIKAAQAFFDPRLIQQAWGGSEEISREQLRVQRLIERNTRRNGGGLPVI